HGHPSATNCTPQPEWAQPSECRVPLRFASAVFCVMLRSHLERAIMTRTKTSALLLSCTVSLASCLVLAQVQRPGEYPRGEKPSPMMSFFVTSEPIGDGGNLGGMAGGER